MKYRLLTILLLLPALPIAAQTAAELDALLDTQAVTVSQAARFALGAAGLLPQGLSGAEAETAAYGLALSKGWARKAAGQGATLEDTAFLVMKAFSLKGGVMYSLLANPRYAYREMAYRGLIQGRADRSMPVSGERLLHTISRALAHTGEDRRPDLELQQGPQW